MKGNYEIQRDDHSKKNNCGLMRAQCTMTLQVVSEVKRMVHGKNGHNKNNADVYADHAAAEEIKGVPEKTFFPKETKKQISHRVVSPKTVVSLEAF